jgi:hypothetical protein
MLWNLHDIADAIERILRDAEHALRAEQAVYGLDSLDESGLQTLLADGLGKLFDVAREVHYPSSSGRKLTSRPRCDLVLTPRGRPLARDDAPPGLFDPVNACPASEALWIEVKLATQYRAPGERHAGYGPQWRQALLDDLRKMEAEPLIREAALLLVVFNESEDVLQKDLDLFEDLLMKGEVLAGFRQTRGLPVLDRMGHRLCTAALWPTVQR